MTMFAKRVFLIAGIIGLIEILPLFFLEQHFSTRLPPPINHPEWYYGFLAVTLPWQLVFLVISTDPVRYRPIMPLAILEKFGFVIVMAILYGIGRTPVEMIPGPGIDMVLGVLFVMAYLKTGHRWGTDEHR
jgi:hypothetical protein